MRILYRIVFLVIAIVLILFAVSNREAVSVEFWPLPFLAGVPLYLLCFLSLLVGALIGVAIAWMAGHHNRRELRARRRRIEALERELMATQSQFEDHSARAKTQLPVDRQLRPFVERDSVNAR
ncbi:MAG TPA: lipopolysaccharide assembly protein LapA domain-containing protein [Stellaceae bacterium]